MIWGTDANCVLLSALLPEQFPKVFHEVSTVLVHHGISVQLLGHTKDIWVRDYSPIQVADGRFVWFDFTPDYLRGFEHLITGNEIRPCFEALGFVDELALILDGGNVVTSRNKAILTEKVYRENSGLSRPHIRSMLKRALGVEQLIIIPKEPFDVLGHADGMVRFINEDEVLFNDMSEWDPQFARRLDHCLVKNGLRTRPLNHFLDSAVVDGIPSAIGNYINFLHTSNVILVPSFAGHDEQNAKAMNVIASAFAPTPVEPIDCSELSNRGGGLNCIAAAVKIEDNHRVCWDDARVSRRPGAM